jgi:hypothetical protein
MCAYEHKPLLTDFVYTIRYLHFLMQIYIFP